MGHSGNAACLLAVFISTASAGLFFPEDLPTALNVAYSRIPAVRAGIDSRYGVGFRIGPNADLQVQWELGPQELTSGQMANQIAPKREATAKLRSKTRFSLPSKAISPSPKTSIATTSSTTTASSSSSSARTSRNTTPDPDYGVKRLRKTILSLFSDT